MQLINTQARDNGGQKGFERDNGFWRRGRIAQAGFLHPVLGIHRATEHAVGDGKEIPAVGFKRLHHAISSSFLTYGSIFSFHQVRMAVATPTGSYSWGK